MAELVGRLGSRLEPGDVIDLRASWPDEERWAFGETLTVLLAVVDPNVLAGAVRVHFVEAATPLVFDASKHVLILNQPSHQGETA